jgi:hypothetical protein
VTDILQRAKALGLKFEDEGTLNQLSESEEFLDELKQRRDFKDSADEDTTIEDETISAAQAAIKALLGKR